MAIIHSCCCRMTLRQGSFACGTYTFVYHTIMLVGATLQVDHIPHSSSNDTTFRYPLVQIVEASHSMTIGYAICSVLTLLASVLLLVGLYLNNRLMLLPWIVMIAMTTFADFIITIYLIGTLTMYLTFAVTVILDFFICIQNVYCMLCVVSQYQVYKDQGSWSEDNIGLQIPTSRNGAPYESNKFLGNGFAAEEPSTGRHLTIPQKTPLGGHHVAKSNAQTNDEVPLTSLWTTGSCNNKERRKISSVKRVQFPPTLEDAQSSSDGVQVSQNSDLDATLSTSEVAGNSEISQESDVNRKSSFSTTVNETLPLLENKAQPAATSL